jgi:hypothetical protein
MSDRTPEPTELIYLPGASWAPPLVAAGIAIMIVATFTAWWWGVIGLVILLTGARAWWRQSDDEISRMRREQQPGTAVLPAEPIRRRRG